MAHKNTNNSEEPHHPTTASTRYTGISGAVFFTGLLAALSGGYALFTAFQNWPAAMLFGLIWGALIFKLNRFIVSSLKKKHRYA